MSGWRRVNLPAPITATIDRLKKEQNEPRWKVVARALITYATLHDDLDKRLYYVSKIMNGWSYVKVYLTLHRQGRVSKEEVASQVRRFIKTLDQIQSRLHIKTSHIIAMVIDIEKGVNGKKIAEINDEIREVIKALLVASV